MEQLTSAYISLQQLTTAVTAGGFSLYVPVNIVVKTDTDPKSCQKFSQTNFIQCQLENNKNIRFVSKFLQYLIWWLKSSRVRYFFGAFSAIFTSWIHIRHADPGSRRSPIIIRILWSTSLKSPLFAQACWGRRTWWSNQSQWTWTISTQLPASSRSAGFFYNLTVITASYSVQSAVEQFLGLSSSTGTWHFVKSLFKYFRSCCRIVLLSIVFCLY